MKASRRKFLIATACLASSASLIQKASADSAPVKESDPNAQALGYRSDAGTVDTARYPKYLAGQHCANCQLYQGKPGDATGPCPIFGGKLVNAKGWCSAYVKKA